MPTLKGCNSFKRERKLEGFVVIGRGEGNDQTVQFLAFGRPVWGHEESPTIVSWDSREKW